MDGASHRETHRKKCSQPAAQACGNVSQSPVACLDVQLHRAAQEQGHRRPKQRIAVAVGRKALAQLARLLLLPAPQAPALGPGAGAGAGGRIGSQAEAVCEGGKAPARRGAHPCRLLLVLLLLGNPLQPRCARNNARLLLLLLAKHQQHGAAQPVLCECGRVGARRCACQAAKLHLLPAQCQQQGPLSCGPRVCRNVGLRRRQGQLLQHPVCWQRQPGACKCSKAEGCPFNRALAPEQLASQTTS